MNIAKKRITLLFCTILLCTISAVGKPRPMKDTLTAKHIEFVENKGQWHPNVLFKTRFNAGAMFAEANCITFVTMSTQQLSDFYKAKTDPSIHHSGMIDAAAYKVHFCGASHAQLSGNDAAISYNNYYIGNDASKWASNVKKYHSIVYNNIYDGISLKFYQEGNHLKYEFQIGPNKSTDIIKLRYEGVNNISVKDGNLIVTTSVSQITELKPFAYQVNNNGDTIEVGCRYKVADKEISYELDEYDKNLTLIIDPVLIFSSYSGSTADNWGYSATFDRSGNLYSGGNVFAIGYPTTTGAYQINYGGGSCDIAISKFDANGSYLHFSTYLGGSSTDIPHSLIVNENDELYVLGSSGSTNFPTTQGAFDSSFHGGSYYLLTNVLSYNNGSDIVISKFNSTGTSLLGSTYLGGSGNDGLNTPAGLKKNYADEVRGEIIIDENSNVYVVSSTQSSDFPTTQGAFSPTFNGGLQDGCVVKMNHNLTNLIWSTYLGGSGNDAAYSIVLAANKSLYVCGGTNSADLAVSNNAVQGNYAGGSTDGYIAHISENGDAVPHCTYLGQSGYDQTYLIKNDRYDNPHVFGQTDAAGTVWVKNAGWYINNGGQFLTKVTPTLDSVIWSTAFGRGNAGIDISPTALLVDLCNNIYMSGWGSPVTNSGLGGTAGLPLTADAFQNTTDNNDYYFICISDDASSLVYASYFGSPNAREHVDGGTSRFDNKGRIYQAVCAGCGGYDDFPTTTGAWSEDNGSSNCNIGVIKFDFNLPAVIADFNIPNTVCAPIDLAFNNTSQSISQNTNYYWDFGDGTSSTLQFPTHHYSQSGIYTIKLVVQDYGSCNFSDTATKQLVVLANSNTTLSSATICNGGFVQIGIPPGGEGVSYQWTPSSALSNPAISNPVATPNATTTYYLYISNGICIDTLAQTVYVENLAVSLPDTLHACAGEPVTLTPSVSGNGKNYYWYNSPPFTQNINPNTSQASYNAVTNQSTMYYVKVTNDFCEAWDSILVAVKPFSVTPPQPYVVCYGDTATISVNISPSGTYSYQWLPTSSIVGSSQVASPVVRTFSGETYTVTVTDEYGCTRTAQVDVVIKKLDSQEQIKAVSCFGGSDGAISITPSGGTAPYFYNWSNGSAVAQMNNLSAGSYSVIITDASGCRTLDTFNISQPQQITVNLVSSSPVECDQICDGALAVSAAGGTGTLHYFWLHGQNDSIATQLCAGIYSVNVVDGNGCSLTESFSLEDNSGNSVNATTDSLHCPHSCDAAIGLELDFHGDNYSLAWDNGETEDYIDSLCAGVYHAHIEVASGCRYDLYIPVSEIPELAFANVFSQAPACNGDTDGVLTLTALGGTPPYKFAVNGDSCSGIAEGLAAGNYSITVIDANGCVHDTSVVLSQPDPLIAGVTVSSPPCPEVCNAIAYIHAEGGNAPYHYHWGNNSYQQTQDNLCVGDYSVKITDMRNCEVTVAFSIKDSSLFPGEVSAWASADTVYDGDHIDLHATEWPDFTYHWQPAGQVTNANSANASANPVTPTTYIVTVSDQYGCKKSDSVFVYVIEVLCEEPYIFVPNAFSPNHDGKNDILYVRGDFIDTFIFRIYNRWGELLFETTDINSGWDGTFKGKDCSTGVYDYYLEVQCLGYKKFFKKGNVTLLR
ncbi:MAG: gliding motility-associated C-terminal domain-containing protein [Bacteroidales bacterium]|nr:gliding motility-associated C-terminal domain-containing protein [Bacteroidales bacterium]